MGRPDLRKQQRGSAPPASKPKSDDQQQEPSSEQPLVEQHEQQEKEQSSSTSVAEQPSLRPSRQPQPTDLAYTGLHKPLGLLGRKSPYQAFLEEHEPPPGMDPEAVKKFLRDVQLQWVRMSDVDRQAYKEKAVHGAPKEPPPRGPRSAFWFFIQENSSDFESGDRQARRDEYLALKERWSKMSDDEKKSYGDKAAEDQTRFDEEVKAAVARGTPMAALLKPTKANKKNKQEERKKKKLAAEVANAVKKSLATNAGKKPSQKESAETQKKAAPSSSSPSSKPQRSPMEISVAVPAHAAARPPERKSENSAPKSSVKQQQQQPPKPKPKPQKPKPKKQPKVKKDVDKQDEDGEREGEDGSEGEKGSEMEFSKEDELTPMFTGHQKPKIHRSTIGKPKMKSRNKSERKMERKKNNQRAIKKLKAGLGSWKPADDEKYRKKFLRSKDKGKGKAFRLKKKPKAAK